MHFPRFIMDRIYLKPLVPKEAEVDSKRVLKSLQRDILKRIRSSLKTQEAFSERVRKALAKSLKVSMMGSSIRITTNHPAFMPLG